MNKEKILESSRRENKNRDLAEKEVTAQAGNIAGRVGAAVCVVLKSLCSTRRRDLERHVHH